MTMLIKGGTIHTMTAEGSFQGDILVQEDRIVAVAPQIDPVDASPCLLDAHGLTIYPGWIDAHIRESLDADAEILRGPNAAGVVAGLLWSREERPCSLLTSGGATVSDIHAVHPALYTDEGLRARVDALRQAGFRIACEVDDPQSGQRVLRALGDSGAGAILLHLTGCEELLEQVAASGCAVVIGAGKSAGNHSWRMACQLNAMGVTVAITCNHPSAKLSHLPLCAALCWREGVDREAALKLITEAPAAILGLFDAGRIQSGGPADLVIYDGDPLLLATSHVMTIAGGKIRHA